MTIQKLVGRAQAAVRAAESAIEELNAVLEAINLEANGFEVRETIVAAAFEMLYTQSAEELSMKYNGHPVSYIHEGGNLSYRVFWFPDDEDADAVYDDEPGNSQCITIVVPKAQ
jgi:hypothetical protein